MGVIVVGGDHSEGAEAAVRFALEEGKLRGARLRVVHAWQFGTIGAPGVVEGAPGGVLVEESRGADLLAVGSRRHGSFARPLLGSVSQQCADHACPVVIVHRKPEQ